MTTEVKDKFLKDIASAAAEDPSTRHGDLSILSASVPLAVAFKRLTSEEAHEVLVAIKTASDSLLLKK